ncbi:MAG: type II secretion system secretin GspD, partial [Paracoccaceae bacterium]
MTEGEPLAEAFDREAPAGPRDALTRPRLLTGSGRLVGQPPDRRFADPGDGEGIMLNFSGAGIREVVDTVLGDTLGLTYAFDEAVEGSVTFRTASPLARSAVLPVLRNILALNGAALVEREGVYAVVPLDAVADLPRVVVTPSRFAQPSGIATYVIPLRAASVDSMRAVLETQVSPGNQLVADRTRNLLLYTGPRQEAQALVDLVEVLDVDLFAGKSFGLFPLDASRADDVATELRFVFADQIGEDESGALRLLPVARLNALLVIANDAALLRRLGDFVATLDRSDGTAGRRVFVYNAANRRATDLADALNQAFLGEAPSPRAERGRTRPRPQPIAPGLDPVTLSSEPGATSPTTSIGRAPSPSARPAETGLGASLELDGADGGDQPIPPRRPSDGDAAADAGLRITALDQNNAILITATEEEHARVLAALRQLDVMPLQVLIEATIAEVSLTDGLEYGVQWAFENGDIGASFDADGPFGPNGIGALFPGFNFVLDATEARVALNALSEISDVEVISSPQLLVLDNQSARLQVGDQVPVATGTARPLTADDLDTVVNSIEYFDTGVILEVTPRVNASGLVTLEIVQEVSDAVPTLSSDIDSPTIQQRTVRSIVSVNSGETIALGGLIRDRASDATSGVPLLQDIPLLGNLFRSTARST